MKNTFRFFKRNLLTLLILFLATFLELYWSTGQLSDQTSSSCLECSFFEDVFLFSLLTGILLSAFSAVFSFIKNTFIKGAVHFILLAAVWFFWNYTVFVERESSWSTYSFREELYITAYLSGVPVIVLGCVSIFLIYYKEIKARFVKSTK